MPRSRSHFALLLASAFVATGCTTHFDHAPWAVATRHGVVASDSPEASQIGATILRRGGNAFDAAVATSFALTVARPESTGLGGGGFLIAYVADEHRYVCLDFRETAPAGATAARYARLHANREDGPSPSLIGGNAVATPGLLAGLEEIRLRWGSQPRAELVAPAIRLAERGFRADAHLIDAIRTTLNKYERWPELRQKCATLYATLLAAGELPALGQRVQRPALAGALRLIADQGPDAFYDGPIANAIVTAVQRAGGPLTRSDLRTYRPIEREPVRAPFRHFEIISMPPPSSGGVCLIEALNIITCAGGPYEQRPERTGPDLDWPALVRSMKLAFRDRARWLGDPDYVDVPVARLISRDYACDLLTNPPNSPQIAPPTDDGGTSHFCVADRAGNVVSLTETINGTFGSLVVAEPFGIILNNEMDDFTTDPGRPNLFGLVQSEANLVEPGKRPLSSMTPTIIARDGKPLLAIGASGGPRIITATMQTILRATAPHHALHEAVAAPRIHHQWRPNRVYFDQEPVPSIARALRRAGETVSAEQRTAAVQAILIRADGVRHAVSDPRKGGHPAAE